MTLDTMLPLIGFAFVMSVSPGPSNFLLLASGVNFGFRRSVPLVLGISSGFLTMVFCVGLGVGQVLQETPSVYAVMKLACAAYVLWLALRIARSRSISPAEGARAARPISFIEAALFQLVNPKAWAVALVVTVSYTQPSNYLASLIAMILVFAAVNLPSISTWAVFGVALRRILDDTRKIRAFNVAMALLLVASMVPVLLESSF